MPVPVQPVRASTADEGADLQLPVSAFLKELDAFAQKLDRYLNRHSQNAFLQEVRL